MNNARGKLVLGEKCVDSQLPKVMKTVLAKGIFQSGSCAFQAK